MAPARLGVWQQRSGWWQAAGGGRPGLASSSSPSIKDTRCDLSGNLFTNAGIHPSPAPTDSAVMHHRHIRPPTVAAMHHMHVCIALQPIHVHMCSSAQARVSAAHAHRCAGAVSHALAGTLLRRC